MAGNISVDKLRLERRSDYIKTALCSSQPCYPTVYRTTQSILWRPAMNLKGLTLSFLMIGLTGCTVTVDEPRPVRPEPPVRACPRIYQPVCAVRGRERQTFSNQCLAASQGFDTIIYPGECRGGPRPPISPRPPVYPEPAPSEPVVCTQEYAPVCARQGSILRTFPNGCIAEGSGFQIIADGGCRG